MQLECKLRRPGGTIVDMPNGEGDADTRYHFKPLDPTRDDSPHVADVVNERHLKMFENALVYVPFGEVPKPPPLPKPEATNEKLVMTDKGLAFVEAVGDAKAPAPRISPIELAAAIADNKFSDDELRDLLATEQAHAAPRKGVVKTLQQALKP